MAKSRSPGRTRSPGETCTSVIRPSNGGCTRVRSRSSIARDRWASARASFASICFRRLSCSRTASSRCSTASNWRSSSRRTSSTLAFDPTPRSATSFARATFCRASSSSAFSCSRAERSFRRRSASWFRSASSPAISASRWASTSRISRSSRTMSRSPGFTRWPSSTSTATTSAATAADGRVVREEPARAKSTIRGVTVPGSTASAATVHTRSSASSGSRSGLLSTSATVPAMPAPRMAAGNVTRRTRPNQCFGYLTTGSPTFERPELMAVRPAGLYQAPGVLSGKGAAVGL